MTGTILAIVAAGLGIVEHYLNKPQGKPTAASYKDREKAIYRVSER